MRDQPGTVYLLHFLKPYRHAKHYRGFARDVAARIEAHRNGTGARLMEVISEAGIGFVVAKTEPGTRSRERQLKQRGASRDCPVCKDERRKEAEMNVRTGDQIVSFDHNGLVYEVEEGPTWPDYATDQEITDGYRELLAEDDRLRQAEAEQDLEPGE